jgi:hypothetical protein
MQIPALLIGAVKIDITKNMPITSVGDLVVKSKRSRGPASKSGPGC